MKAKVLLLFFTVSLIFGCKKGDNDPVFSLKSRKARLTGAWVVESAEWNSGDTTWIFDGTNLTRTDTNSIDVVDYSYKMEFDAAGNYVTTMITTYPIDNPDTTLSGVSCELVESGLWNFTGGAGTTKTKSELLLLSNKTEEICSDQPASVNTVSVTGQNRGVVYSIDRLSDKELLLMYGTEVASVNGTNIRTAEIILKKEVN
jgi:hypothetical protein